MFPKHDVRMEYLHESEYVETHDQRGDTEFWHLEVDGMRQENAAFSHLEHGAADYVRFKWDAMERWVEEEEEIFVHARNPYHRVDALPSSRHIEVELDGVLLARSDTPVLLFETGLPTRYYLHVDDVKMDLLQRTATVTRCPYKGIAQTYAVHLDGKIYSDFAWLYPDPIAECANTKDRVCFYNEVVDIREDGRALARPKTHFK